MVVTRAVLSSALCVACLTVGLATAVMSARNHQRASRLDELHRTLEAQRMANARLRARNLEDRRSAAERARQLAAERAAPIDPILER
jgi:cobalamin-dependent methionine synthase I